MNNNDFYVYKVPVNIELLEEIVRFLNQLPNKKFDGMKSSYELVGKLEQHLKELKNDNRKTENGSSI